MGVREPMRAGRSLAYWTCHACAGILLVSIVGLGLTAVMCSGEEKVEVEAESAGAGMSDQTESPRGLRILVSVDPLVAISSSRSWDGFWSDLLEYLEGDGKWRLLIDGSDIVAFDWEKQEFMVKPELAEYLAPEGAYPTRFFSRAFLLKVNGNLIYGGAIIEPFSPAAVQFPVLHMRRESGATGPLVLQLRGSMLYPMLGGEPDPMLERLIRDERIRRQLEQYGVLRGIPEE